MKGDRLGEFEEVVLLAVLALGGDTYAVPVQQYLEEATGRPVAMGAVYAALERIEGKGFVTSAMGEVTRQRGGKRRRLFSATAAGKRALHDARTVRDRLWQAIEGRS